ncbi:MAG: twin-arginine translocase subunit TatC [Thermodesulfobacteriota bacterium]
MMTSQSSSAKAAPDFEASSGAKKIVATFMELRTSLLWLAALLALGTLAFYFYSPQLFALIQGHLNQKLSFFTVSEPFLAHVKLALVATIYSLLPVFTICFWRGLARPFKLSGLSQFSFISTTIVLFYSGSLFCYFITLPFGVNFLLGFESEQLNSVISVGRFVTFVTIFILAFGLIFELPIFMVFAGKVGLVPRATFAKNRRYALLIIAIVAALLTPTPDIVNMLLMGGPLYLLFEAGIMILAILRIP